MLLNTVSHFAVLFFNDKNSNWGKMEPQSSFTLHFLVDEDDAYSFKIFAGHWGNINISKSRK